MLYSETKRFCQSHISRSVARQTELGTLRCTCFSSHTHQGGMIVGQRPFYRQTGESISQKSIAVLPFENLTGEKANAYFADGIQDEILTKLAGIGDLKVISRSSTARYKSKPEDLKTVARELGVATVLEGSVQRLETECG